MKSVNLKLGDTEFKLALGLYFVGHLQSVYKVELDDVLGVSEEILNKKGEVTGYKQIKKPLLERNPFKYVPEYIYYSAKLEAELSEVIFDYKLRDFIELIDGEGGVNGEKSIAFITAFAKSLHNENVPETENIKTIDTKKK